MAVVRIDDKLHKDVTSLINKKNLKYKYPTISAFVNRAIYEKIMKLNGEKDKSDENE